MGMVASHGPEQAKSSQTDLSKVSAGRTTEAEPSQSHPRYSMASFSSCLFNGACSFLESEGPPSCRAPGLERLWVIISSVAPIDRGGSRGSGRPCDILEGTDPELDPFCLSPRSEALSTNLCLARVCQGPVVAQVHAVKKDTRGPCPQAASILVGGTVRK